MLVSPSPPPARARTPHSRFQAMSDAGFDPTRAQHSATGRKTDNAVGHTCASLLSVRRMPPPAACRHPSRSLPPPPTAAPTRRVPVALDLARRWNSAVRLARESRGARGEPSVRLSIGWVCAAQGRRTAAGPRRRPPR